MEPTMTNGFLDVRVVYRKRGRLKFISHLDMNRLMQRAIARAQLPAWYTQGFNPHLYLTFALPLSLGVESEYEIMDLRLTRPLEGEALLTRLNAQLPRGIEAWRAAPPERGVADIAWSDYDVSLPTKLPEAEALEALRALSGGPVLVEKKTKKGVKELDIAPLVSVSGGRWQTGRLCFSLRCASGGDRSVNPALYLGALCVRMGGDARDADVLRTAVRGKDGALFV